MNSGNVLFVSDNKNNTILHLLGYNEKLDQSSGLYVHKSDILPYTIVEFENFESSIIKQQNSFYRLKKWENENSKINVIWLHLNGTTLNELNEHLEAYKNFLSLYNQTPVLLILNKKLQEKISNSSFKQVKVKSIIYYEELSTKLISCTNKLMPMNKRLNINKLSYKQKKSLSQALIATSTASAVVVGAVPISFADALILTPLEVGMIKGISKIYGIQKSDQSISFVNTIVEIGTVSLAAKSTISALKSIPGLHIATSIMNAVIAGCFVFAIGEASDYAFSEISKGNKTLADIDWLKKMVESKLTQGILKNAEQIMHKISESGIDDLKTIALMILEIFKSGK